MRFVGFICALISARFVYLRKSESVFSIICSAVSSLHFNFSCCILCCSLYFVSSMHCLWWSIVISSRVQEPSVRVFSQQSLNSVSRQSLDLCFILNPVGKVLAVLCSCSRIRFVCSLFSFSV